MNHDTCHVRLTLSVLFCISFGLYQSHPLRFNHQNTSIYRIIIPKGLTVLITYVHHYTHYTCLLVIFLSLHETIKTLKHPCDCNDYQYKVHVSVKDFFLSCFSLFCLFFPIPTGFHNVALDFS